MKTHYIIEGRSGLVLTKNGSLLKFDTKFEALNFIDDHELENAVVRLELEEED